MQIRLAGRSPISRSFDTREEAVEWARIREGELQRRPRGEDGRQTVSDAIDRYARTVLPTKRASTGRSQAQRLKWWDQRIGDRRLSDLTPKAIAAARDELASRLAPGTVNRYLAAISHVITMAQREWEWISHHPVKAIKRKQEPPGRVRYLEEPELVDLLAACREQHRGTELAALVTIAVTTGLRRGELSGLTWDRVDLSRRVLRVYDTKTGEPRGVPLVPEAVAAVRSLPRRIDTPLLFPSRDPLRPWDFRKPWGLALAQAGIEDFRFHDLRHTAASHLAMAGATPSEIAAVLGHKTLVMVKRYAHLSPEHVRRVMVSGLSRGLFGGRRRGRQSPDGDDSPGGE